MLINNLTSHKKKYQQHFNAQSAIKMRARDNPYGSQAMSYDRKVAAFSQPQVLRRNRCSKTANHFIESNKMISKRMEGHDGLKTTNLTGWHNDYMVTANPLLRQISRTSKHSQSHKAIPYRSESAHKPSQIVIRSQSLWGKRTNVKGSWTDKDTRTQKKVQLSNRPSKFNPQEQAQIPRKVIQSKLQHNKNRSANNPNNLVTQRSVSPSLTKSDLQYLHELKFNQVIFCMKCLRYVFAIEKHFHFPECQKFSDLNDMTPAQGRLKGLSRIAMIVELSEYTKICQEQIKNIQNQINNNSYRQVQYCFENRKYLKITEMKLAVEYIYRKLIKLTHPKKTGRGYLCDLIELETSFNS